MRVSVLAEEQKALRFCNPEPIVHQSQLGSIKDEWNEIYSEIPSKSPFLSFEFITLWYECFAAADEVRVYPVTHEGQTIGFLPLVLRRERGIRILRGLTNDHCMHSTFLVKNGFVEILRKLILQELLRDNKGWDVLSYDFVYAFSEAQWLFSCESLSSSGLAWEDQVQPTYVALIPRSFEYYFHKCLMRHVRGDLTRRKKHLLEAGRGDFSHYRGREALEKWPNFLVLEDSGWKGAARTSIKKESKNVRRYYEGLIRILADADALHLYFLELHGEAIAGEFGYTEGDTFHSLKTGYNERMKEFSPSHLLRLDIIKHLISESPKIRWFHMFPGDHGWKHQFVNVRACCLETILYNRTLRGRAAQTASAFERKLRKVPGLVASVRFGRDLLKGGRGKSLDRTSHSKPCACLADSS